jgi:hypothetical protein
MQTIDVSSQYKEYFNTLGIESIQFKIDAQWSWLRSPDYGHDYEPYRKLLVMVYTIILLKEGLLQEHLPSNWRDLQNQAYILNNRWFGLDIHDDIHDILGRYLFDLYTEASVF